MCVCVCVIYCVCYHREALAAAIWNKENHCHVHPSVVSTSWSEEYRFLEWHRDKVLFWVISFFFSPGQVAVKSLSTLHGNVIGFYAFLLKYVVRNHHLELFVFWISRHIRSAAHTVSISVRKHITMATVLHWQNIILIWDTHKKGRAIRTQGSLE